MILLMWLFVILVLEETWGLMGKLLEDDVSGREKVFPKKNADKRKRLYTFTLYLFFKLFLFIIFLWESFNFVIKYGKILKSPINKIFNIYLIKTLNNVHLPKIRPPSVRLL